MGDVIYTIEGGDSRYLIEKTQRASGPKSSDPNGDGEMGLGFGSTAKPWNILHLVINACEARASSSHLLPLLCETGLGNHVYETQAPMLVDLYRRLMLLFQCMVAMWARARRLPP